MNQSLVAVDASVGVKWVVTVEHLATEAQQLFSDSITSGRRLIAPPHLPGEVANALYQRTRTQIPGRRLSHADAEAALHTFLSLPVAAMNPPGLHETAFDLARTYGLASVYDALYVALAQLTGSELWTADQRLLNSMGARARWVRFIGDYPLA